LEDQHKSNSCGQNSFVAQFGNDKLIPVVPPMGWLLCLALVTFQGTQAKRHLFVYWVLCQIQLYRHKTVWSLSTIVHELQDLQRFHIVLYLASGKFNPFAIVALLMKNPGTEKNRGLMHIRSKNY
jgi:hypothetical protein